MVYDNKYYLKHKKEIRKYQNNKYRERFSLLKIKCFECNETFTQKNIKQRFCCKKCSDNNWHRDRPRIKKLKIKNCFYCNKEFRTFQNKTKFCSVSCAKKYNWKMKNSPYRNKNYLNKISLGRKEWYKHNEHPKGMLGKKQSEKAIKSSSERCKLRLKEKHPNWIGGSQPYWNKIARRIVKDVPNICYYGQKNNKLECKGKILVHHKDRNIKNNKKKNLIKTCKYHHITYYHRKEQIEKIKNMNKARLKKIKENPEWWKKVCKKNE